MKTARKAELIGTLLILASMAGCGGAVMADVSGPGLLASVAAAALGFGIFLVGRFLD
jgi:hypothetical protein